MLGVWVGVWLLPLRGLRLWRVAHVCGGYEAGETNLCPEWVPAHRMGPGCGWSVLQFRSVLLVSLIHFLRPFKILTDPQLLSINPYIFFLLDIDGEEYALHFVTRYRSLTQTERDRYNYMVSDTD